MSFSLEKNIISLGLLNHNKSEFHIWFINDILNPK